MQRATRDSNSCARMLPVRFVHAFGNTTRNKSQCLPTSQQSRCGMRIRDNEKRYSFVCHTPYARATLTKYDRLVQSVGGFRREWKCRNIDRTKEKKNQNFLFVSLFEFYFLFMNIVVSFRFIALFTCVRFVE